MERAGFTDIEVVNVATGKRTCAIKSRGASLAFTPDGKALVAVSENEGALYDPATGKLIRRLKGYQAESPQVGGFSADGNILAIASGGWRQDGLLRFWNLASGEEIRSGGGHQDAVTCLAYTPDGKTLASGSRDRTIRLWDPATSRELRRLEGHDGEVLAVAFSPDGKTLASSSEDGTTRLWEFPGGRELARLDGPVGGATFLAFADDGKTLSASSQAGKTQIWELADAKKTTRREAAGKNPTLLGLTPHGTAFLTTEHLAYADKEPDLLRLVSLTTLRPIRVMTLNPCRHPNTRFLCVGATVSDDGKRIASWQTTVSSNHPLPKDHGPALQVWERATGQEVFKIMFTYFDKLTFSRDGRLLAASHPTDSSDWRIWAGGLTIYDSWTGDRLGELPGHAAHIGALAISPDGKTLASGSSDHTILLWKNNVELKVKPAKVEPTAKLLETWWDDLGTGNAAAAHRSLAMLVAHPAQTVRLIGERLEPAPHVNAAHIAGLVKDLDSPNFATRQKASVAIEKLETADVALSVALADNPPLETRRRLELVLAKVEQAPPTPTRLRSHRAITALQWIATPAARQVLEKLAGGAPAAHQTLEASAALKLLNAGSNDDKRSPRVGKLVDESAKKKAIDECSLLNENPLKPGDIPEALKYIKKNAGYTSYHLLLAIRKYHPASYKDISTEDKAKVLCSALANSYFLNDWGYLSEESFDGDSAKALLEIGKPALKFLVPVMESDKEGPLFGGKEALLSSFYHYRRKDFAYRYISLILGQPPPAFSKNAKERDKDIESLKLKLKKDAK